MPVTRHPSSPAAYSAKPPQPQPISSTCVPGPSPAFAASRAYLWRWAASRVDSGDGKTALE